MKILLDIVLETKNVSPSKRYISVANVRKKI